MLNALRNSARQRRIAEELHARLVARARAPYFFTALSVADTVDGRFDMMALHAWLTLDALNRQGQADLAQRLTDTLFVGFEEALREQGAGDISLGHRMKKIADAFYGRLSAYAAAEDEARLTEAIARNVYRGQEEHREAAAQLARYAARARARLQTGELGEGSLDFGPERDA